MNRIAKFDYKRVDIEKKQAEVTIVANGQPLMDVFIDLKTGEIRKVGSLSMLNLTPNQEESIFKGLEQGVRYFVENNIAHPKSKGVQ